MHAATKGSCDVSGIRGAPSRTGAQLPTPCCNNASAAKVNAAVSGEPLDELVSWARGKLPRLVDNMYAAVCDRIDLYGDNDVVPHDDLKRSISLSLQFVSTLSRIPVTRRT